MIIEHPRYFATLPELRCAIKADMVYTRYGDRKTCYCLNVSERMCSCVDFMGMDGSGNFRR